MAAAAAAVFVRNITARGGGAVATAAADNLIPVSRRASSAASGEQRLRLLRRGMPAAPARMMSEDNHDEDHMTTVHIHACPLYSRCPSYIHQCVSVPCGRASVCMRVCLFLSEILRDIAWEAAADESYRAA